MTESGKNRQKVYNKLLIYIIIGIIFGVLLGGFLPEWGKKVDIFGDIFLHLLMMLVIPIVVLSMITGITGLGDIRKVGTLGWHTLLYYFVTTALAVLVGLIAVNLIKPGQGVTSGESHPQYDYEIRPAEPHTVILQDGSWEKLNYDEKYEIVLLDQRVKGAIASMNNNRLEVRFWENLEGAAEFHIRAEDGSLLPFIRIDRTLVSREPEIEYHGTGLEIRLGISEKILDKEGSSLLATLKEVLLGNQETGQQGLIPRNVVRAMSNLDILSVIFFSLLIGAALTVLGPKVDPLLESIRMLNEAVMQLVHWIMLFAPIGIFGLIAARIGQAGGFVGFLPELMALSKYTLTVFLGLAFHMLITLPLILRFIGKRNPLTYAKGVGAALLNAFSTASSSATLPLTMEGVQDENGVSQKVSSFVLPLGATINMDGTALYESVAAIFIAQVYGIELGLSDQIIVFFTATLAAIGAAGIPEAGLVTMVIVLKAVGLPLEGVALILAIDWLLDRFRTTTNVWGDSVGAAVIEKLEKLN